MTDLKKKIASKEIAFGTMLSEVATPNIGRIMKTAGYEFIIVDCEHGYFDFSQLANIVSVANGFQLPVLVRIPAIEREYITKVLDMGGDGFLVPMVNTPEEARRLVNFAKYPPLGKRGISIVRPHTNYAPPPLEEYIESANRKTILLVQIETREGVGNAAEIAAVDGIDALVVGPNDLSLDFGTSGALETPEMEGAIRAVVDAAKSAGKTSGIVGSNISFLHKWRDYGMTVFCCGSEVGMIMKAAKQNHDEFFNTRLK